MKLESKKTFDFVSHEADIFFCPVSWSQLKASREENYFLHREVIEVPKPPKERQNTDFFISSQQFPLMWVFQQLQLCLAPQRRDSRETLSIIGNIVAPQI